MTDKELMQEVYSGNQEALSDLIELYYADIFRFCLYMVQSEDDAYDITQETFLKFIKYSSAYRQYNLKGYLLTISAILEFKKNAIILMRGKRLKNFPFKMTAYKTQKIRFICRNC